MLAQIQRSLQEVASTIGRIRRGGWFDVEVVRFAAQINGVSQIFLTKLDILSQFNEVQICTGYEWNSKRVHYYDVNAYELREVKPIYRTMRGWRTDISGVRKYSDLPARDSMWKPLSDWLACLSAGSRLDLNAKQR